MPGHETATRPLVGADRATAQPRAADVPTSDSLSVLDQEDADVDRKISGVLQRLLNVAGISRRWLEFFIGEANMHGTNATQAALRLKRVRNQGTKR